MPANPVHVNHVRKYLDEKLGPEINIDDLKGASAEKQVEGRRTRSLAALAVQYLTRCSEADAALSVIDGSGDNGIDAIAWDLDASHLYLVQAKWSETGKASLTRSLSQELVSGLRLITEHKHVEFNPRYQTLADFIATVVDQPRFKVTFVPILMGTASIDKVAAQPMTDVVEELNEVHQCASIEYLRLPEIHEMVTNGVHQVPVHLKVHLEGSAKVSEPHLAYYGCASAEDISGWFQEHGARLFERNIRSSLGTTDVNTAIGKTLTDEPDNFWYFNNGITIICSNIDRSGLARLRPSGPADLLLENASVVNGAQTVSAIHSAVEAQPEEAGSALVWVRVIQFEGEAFAKRVTETNNTQNGIDLRDFAANDPVQQQLRRDFASMELTYVIKRGEDMPRRDQGCDITEAAHALAAACPNTDVVVDAHRDPNLLWQSDSRGRYDLLFHRGVREIRLWRTVLVHRAVARRVKEREEHLMARAGGFAKNLSHLVAHAVLRYLETERLDRHGPHFEDEVLPDCPRLADNALTFMIAEADRLYGNYFPASLANNYERCTRLADLAVEHLRSGQSAGELPDAYRTDVNPPKKDNAVIVINRYQAIEAGDRVDFRAQTPDERKHLTAWLNELPTRRFATWVVAKRDVLKWEYDGETYSATGLFNRIWQEATGRKARSVQGTKYWYVGERGSLVDIAEKLRSDAEDTELSGVQPGRDELRALIPGCAA